MPPHHDDTVKRMEGPLRLNEEDIAEYGGTAYQRSRNEGGDSTPHPRKGGFSFIKLFLTLIFAAPVATLLSLMARDFYNPPPSVATAALIERAALTAATDATPATKAPAAISERQLKAIVAALGKQTRALEKIAAKKPAPIELKTSVAPSSALPPKVIVVKVPSREKFDLTYEIQKILELSGVDLDDPVTNHQPFGEVKSRPAMKEVIRSLDAIIAASRTNAEVTDFLKSNALRAKGHALSHLKKL